MSLQAYLDNIKARTGKGPEDFRQMAAEKGLTTHRQLVDWLKADYQMNNGHASAIASALLKG